MVVFAVPGSKTYVNRHYKNNPRSFLNVSITGSTCQLMCSHCRGFLLKDMIDINDFHEDEKIIKTSAGRFMQVIDYFGEDNVCGMLVSGGFDSSGRLPLDVKIMDELAKVKELKADSVKVIMHLGFINAEEIRLLQNSAIDGVLVNIFSDMYSIKEVYNLKGLSPHDFYMNLRNIKNAGIKVSPHLILGLGCRGNIEGEFISIDEISKIGTDSLVFAIEKKLTKNHRNDYKEVRIQDIVRLYEYARKLMPQTPLALGCARPPGAFSEELEMELIKRGIDSIAFPSEKAIDFALENNLSFCFKEQCCAF